MKKKYKWFEILLKAMNCDDKNYGDIMRLIICVAVVVIYIDVLCIFGGEVTVEFDQTFDSIREISWNEFPLKSQKLLLMMIITGNKPIYIQGFMNTDCTHEMLKKV